jgi:uncharacterized protein YjiS (DUF1127 family)
MRTFSLHPRHRRHAGTAARLARGAAIAAAAPLRLVARLARAWRDRNHYAALLNADERLLGDIGLTRADLHAMIADPWLRGQKNAALRAAERRQAEMRVIREHAIDPGNFS